MSIGVYAAILLIVAVGLVVAIRRTTFRLHVARAVRDLEGAVPSAAPLVDALDLPRVVARYRVLAASDRTPVKTLILRHGGTFRTSPGAKLLPIQGVQHFTADPPGYVWSARVRQSKGIWIDACDSDIAGKGRMRVMLASSLGLVDAKGDYIDQGAALRALAEMPWFPTALFDTRYVRWSPIDDSHALATLRVGQQEVSCVFEFGPDGLPSRITAERFRNASELRPWIGTYKDYRRIAGMLVPFDVEVTWLLESGPYTYAHWRIDSFEYDPPRSGIETPSLGMPSKAAESALRAHAG